MKSKGIKHQLKGVIYLDILNLESKLIASDPVEFMYDQIFFDLSQCRFAELGALTKLLLIIERHLINHHKIYLALPNIQYSSGEQHSEHFHNTNSLKENILKRRKGTNNFLKKCGFVSAVQDIGVKYESEILITENYDFEKKGFSLSSFQDSFAVVFEPYLINDQGYKFLLPFRWIDCRNDLREIEDFNELEDKINRILGNKERGLDGLDVKGIRNVILSELIKNVKEHSDTKYALFTIGLISSDTLFYIDQFKKHNPVEDKYLQWLQESKIKSQVELYFGDSGVGLLNKAYENYVKSAAPDYSTSKKKLLEFAFTKWSSLKDNEPRRGTKGLYRLLRIVNKYNGLVHIDTSRYNGGYSRNAPVFRQTDYDFAGTIINIKLNPFKEIQLVKYFLEGNNSIISKWHSKKYRLTHDLSCLQLIKKEIRKVDNLLVILDTMDLNFALEADQKLLEELMYEISFDANPTTVVIYLIGNSGNITIATIVESVQTRIHESLGNEIIPEIRDEDFEEIHDPVFVLGSNNEAFWYGGSNELISILRESYEKGGPIYELDAFKVLGSDNKNQILLHLKSYDNDLIKLTAENEIAINFRSIEKHYERTITNTLQKSLLEMRCSPKLFMVDKWIDVPKMLEKDEYGFALSLYILYRSELNNRGTAIEKIDRENIFILIDDNIQAELAKKFAELLGIKAKNIRNIESDIDTNIPKRTKLFPKHANVIFLTTMISSSETIRRLVKYAKRDYALPDVILCLGNFRTYNIDHLETWSDTTRILSCYQHNQIDSTRYSRDGTYFESKYLQLNKLNLYINPDLSISSSLDKKNNLIKVDDTLIVFLQTHKLLHYNHYGFYNKRHFTFFLDKIKILNTESFLWNRITTAFERWLQAKKISNYKIYVNASVLGDNSAFLRVLRSFSNNNVIIFDKRVTYVNEPDVIYFDFGILTGESINDFLGKCRGVKNLLVCLLFDQAVNSNKDLYKRINTIKNFSLAGDIELTDFDIDYLFHLPLSFFTSENCPICEHRRALDFFKSENSYLLKFSEDRQERLKQSPIDAIYELDYPVDFYYAADALDQELSSVVVVQMYKLKILLENAKKFTSSRIETYNFVYELWIDLDNNIQHADSNVYALLYYLSHEINWFQQEPLIFRDLRILISEIALRVAIEPVVNLTRYFDHTNFSNIKSAALAIRYKYAAISILRSTDKLVFCQNISKMISSGIYGTLCSNNLLQNALYHISSFYKNGYNKSELYYIEILVNLSRVLKEIELTDEQRSAIQALLVENSKARRRIINVLDEPAKFKEMKDKWESIYISKMPAHPAPYMEFKHLILSKYDDFFDDWKNGKISQEGYQTIETRISQISNSWSSLKTYFENNIFYYFRNNLSKLYESSFFDEHFDTVLNVEEYDANVKRLDELIKSIEKDWSKYLNNRDDYNGSLNYFQHVFIEKNKLSDFTEDSQILQLLAEFPANVTDVVHEVFSNEDYPRKKFYLQNRGDLFIVAEEAFNVYFPVSQLRIYLRLISENLNKRLNKESESFDVNLRFIISVDEKDLLLLEIIYDLTDESQDIPNPNGSLSAFRILLNEFGGELEYYTPTSDNKDFTIQIKFLRYE
jgi:hypothetical protein